MAEFRTRRELAAGERAAIVERFRAGAAMKVIAAELEVDRRAVRRVLYDAGVAMPPRRLSADEVAEAARRYEEGMSLSQLGERFGVSAQTMRNKLVAAGVELRPRPGWIYTSTPGRFPPRPA